MEPGKLPLHLLSRLLNDVDTSDPRVVVGPRVGEDAALIDFGDRYLVAKTDPITFATDLIGWYMVNVNANDIAVMGATPKWLLATVLLPEGTSESQVTEMFRQIQSASADLGVALVGGHTEITVGLDRPIAVGAMLGEVDKDRAVLSSGVRPGDAVILTKGIALEGTSILAREVGDGLRELGIGADLLRAAANLLFDPGISVVADARIACSAADVHAMHDPTEGGLSGGLYELAAAGVGFEIDQQALPVLPECVRICESLDLDLLGLIASGSLLATVDPNDAHAVVDSLRNNGIESRVIGSANTRSGEVTLRTRSGPVDFPRFERDELARYFGGAQTA